MIISKRADSVTWNPHKLMGASLQCSAFLIKRKVVAVLIIKSTLSSKLYKI